MSYKIGESIYSCKYCRVPEGSQHTNTCSHKIFINAKTEKSYFSYENYMQQMQQVFYSNTLGHSMPGISLTKDNSIKIEDIPQSIAETINELEDPLFVCDNSELDHYCIYGFKGKVNSKSDKLLCQYIANLEIINGEEGISKSLGKNNIVYYIFKQTNPLEENSVLYFEEKENKNRINVYPITNELFSDICDSLSSTKTQIENKINQFIRFYIERDIKGALIGESIINNLIKITKEVIKQSDPIEIGFKLRDLTVTNNKIELPETITPVRFNKIHKVTIDFPATIKRIKL